VSPESLEVLVGARGRGERRGDGLVCGAGSFADEYAVFLLGFALLERTPQNLLVVRWRGRAALGHVLLAARRRGSAGHRLRACGKLSPSISRTEARKITPHTERDTYALRGL